MPPFHTSVVHIVDFRKEEYLDRHVSHGQQTAGKRPFLCVLTPDTLQLVTASDASDTPTPMSTTLLKLATGKPDRTPRGPARPMSLLHKLATSNPVGAALSRDSQTHDRQGGGSSGEEVAAAAAAVAPPPVEASGSRLLRVARGGGGGEGGDELGEQLAEGQLLKFTVALSQVAGLECNDRRVKVLFHRQKPHCSSESSDDWKAMMKAAVLPFAMPIEAYKHQNWEVSAFINRHRRDPFVSSVVLEADSPQEAAALHAAMETAIARLAQAVQWLSQDLPLQLRPVVTLVSATTAAAAGEPAGAGAAALAGPASPVRMGGGDALAPGVAASEQIICAFPRMQQPLDIPIPGAPATLDAGLAGGGSSGGSSGGCRGGGKVGSADEDGAGASGDELAGDAELAVHVWLHSPLGPAVATITAEQLQKSAEAGGAPLVVVATPHQEPAATEEAPRGRDRLEVVLQFKAERRAASPACRRLASFPSRTRRRSSLPGGGSTTWGLPGPLGSSSSSGSALPAIFAVLCIPLLSFLLQLQRGSEGGGGSGGGAGASGSSILASVSFLVSSVAALAAIVVLQLKSQGVPPAMEQALTQPPPPPPVGWWRLVLLHAELVHESLRSSGAPTVRRVVSSSTLPSTASSAAVVRLDGSAAELPAPIRLLVEQHPSVLTEDIASRFLVGLGTADKAYQALRNMVEWVEAQGVQDLVRQPQPRFEVIKAHYPQVFYCWSTRSDCVLEVECTGKWRQAFDSLRALGVTERELLRHQFFCMEYAFKVLDTRPLPQGKTVKIIDLEGLGMRDVSSSAFKWYLQVGGALLAVNYPQRLHKAFLLNAPAWSGVIWKVLAAVIPRRTREQLMLFTHKQKEAATEALLQWVPAEQLPVAYGGKCTVPLGESELERDMAAYVSRLNSTTQGGSGSRGIPGKVATAAHSGSGSGEADLAADDQGAQPGE